MPIILMDENDLKKFENYLRSKRLSDKSCEDYLYYYRKFADKYIFTQQGVDDFIQKYSSSGARAFINNYKAYLLRLDPDDIDVRKIELVRQTGRKAVRITKFITLEEMGDLGRVMNNSRDVLMLLISFYCGLRRSELLNIRINDFNWSKWYNHRREAGELRIIGKGDKERIVFISPQLMNEIEQWIYNNIPEERDGLPIFSISGRRWVAILHWAGMKALGKKVNPHQLRHSSATWMISNNMYLKEIADLLGHKSVATTQIYAHIDKRGLKKKYNNLFQESTGE